MSEDKDWAAESARAMDEHDPTLEPYASMDKWDLFELMDKNRDDPYKCEMYHQFFLDKCTAADLERVNFANELSIWLMEKREVFGDEQAKLCQEVALEATYRLFNEMPPPAPIHQIN